MAIRKGKIVGRRVATGPRPMIMKPAWIFAFILIGTFALAQAPSASLQPAATMKQLMLDLIHPASNDILLSAYRGGPQDEKEWAAVRRAAVTLAESGNTLMLPGRAPIQGNAQGDWTKYSKMLADAGAAAYKAAQAKDGKALAALAEPLDAACTACHKQYRPNVFPHAGESK